MWYKAPGSLLVLATPMGWAYAVHDWGVANLLG